MEVKVRRRYCSAVADARPGSGVCIHRVLQDMHRIGWDILAAFGDALQPYGATRRHLSRQVDHFEIAPVMLEILGNKTTVAVVRLILATQQAAAIEERTRQSFFDSPLLH